MYKLTKFNIVERLLDSVYIPFDSANCDYQNFKKELVDGVELQDENGNVMTTEQVLEFFHTLP